MDLKAEKIELVKMILNTEDQALIQEVMQVFKSHEVDFWETLPEHVKSDIEKGREELRNGNYISYEEVKKELDKI